MRALIHPILAAFLATVLPACGHLSDKQDTEQAPSQPATGSTGSAWDQRIGDRGSDVHAARIGAASIDTLSLGGPASSPKVADYLADPSPEVRSKSVEQLAKWGKQAQPAVPRILEHLRNADPNIRTAAARALASIASEQAESGLERARKDQDPRVRVWAHAGLARIEGDCEDHAEDVAKLLGSGPAASDAALALRHLGCANQDVVKILIHSLNGGDESTRSAAARALGSIGPQAASAVPSLMGALGEKSFRIRQAALIALAGMGAKAAPAVPMLTQVLGDPAPRFRDLAARALGAVGPAARSAVPMLEKLTRDQEASVQAAAKRALASIGQHKPEDGTHP